MSYQNANVGIPMENGAIGGSLSYLNYGSIAGYASDAGGRRSAIRSAYSGVATLGAAWLGNQWSAGVNVKGIQEKLADENANGAAFDVGANVIYPKPVMGGTLRLGAVVQNLGSGIKFEQQKDPLPTDYKVGVAAVQMMDKKLNVSLDYANPKDDDCLHFRRLGILGRSVSGAARRLCEQPYGRVWHSGGNRPTHQRNFI